MFGKAITYKTTKKCLADNRTAKYEASVGPAENLSPRSDEFQNLCNTTITCKFYIPNYDPAFNNIKQSSSVLQNNVIHCFKVLLCSIAIKL